jgi:hypothetical protein
LRPCRPGDIDGGGDIDGLDEPGGKAAAQVAADAAAEQAFEEEAGIATTEAELQAALAKARPATSSSPPPPGGAASGATAAVRASNKIVYVHTRKGAEALAKYFDMCGVRAGIYRAGWPERARVAASWHAGELEVVCATIAFGLGVDNPNVTHVVTWGYGRELDQQWGRAGRGGHKAASRRAAHSSCRRSRRCASMRVACRPPWSGSRAGSCAGCTPPPNSAPPAATRGFRFSAA